jgi:O-antigen/teichoic acid export membrane protein
MMNRTTSFVLYALVGRHLGANEFGQLTLAFTLFYTFQVFAVSGLKTLVIRQVAKDRTETARYFVNGCMIVTLTSTASIAAVWGFVRLMHYPHTTSVVILLLSFGLLPYTFSAICEGIFQAWERMRYIAYVNVPVNIAKVAATVLLLITNRRLFSVILVLLGCLFSIAAIELWILLRRFPLQWAAIDRSFAWTTARAASTFLGIDGTLAIMTSLNVLLLSKLASEVEVGLYSAASQLMVPLLLVYQSIAQSIFPMMCRKLDPSYRSLKQIAENAIELLMVLALPAVAGLYFLGNRVIALLYKNPVFIQAFPALRIMAFVLIFQVFTSVLGQVLVASHREKITLRIVVVDTVTNLLVGWPLISLFGLRGAAIALFFTRLTDCIQHYIPSAQLLSGIPIWKLIWKPVIAAACMAVYLAMPEGRLSLLTGVSATLLYGAALFGLAVWASGGVHQFLEKYRPLLSE